MNQFLISFFTYNYQINQSLADRFKSYGFQMDGDICRLANHLMNAHQIWLERISGNVSLQSPWADFPLESFADRNQNLYEQTLALMETCDLDEFISYKNFAGAGFEKKVSDILLHVINHSTYHRGQIALLMRSKGLEPVASDYIHWVN